MTCWRLARGRADARTEAAIASSDKSIDNLYKDIVSSERLHLVAAQPTGPIPITLKVLLGPIVAKRRSEFPDTTIPTLDLVHAEVVKEVDSENFLAQIGRSIEDTTQRDLIAGETATFKSDMNHILVEVSASLGNLGRSDVAIEDKELPRGHAEVKDTMQTALPGLNARLVTMQALVRARSMTVRSAN